MIFLDKYKHLIIDLLTVGVLLLLPYYIFEGRLFIGGDDTRMMYIFPREYIWNMAFFSWSHISSIGAFNPNQHAIPLMLLLDFLLGLLKSKVVIDYLVFSLPLILGFVYFRLLVKEIYSKVTYLQSYIGSLFYIFSPILLIMQLSIFLYSAWLIGLIPLTFYYFLRYLKTGKFINIVIAVLWSIIFSIGFYSIPWSFAFLPVVCISCAILYFFSVKKERILFLKRGLTFFGLLGLSHSYWLIPFAATFLLNVNSSIGAKVLSSGVANTFKSTVESTATGNVLFPLLNLFHRSIPFDFSWQVKKIYEGFYDKTFWINGIFIIVFYYFVRNHNVFTEKKNSKEFIFLLSSLILSLFFFTVNVGPLSEVFYTLGNLPGFVMFRNFYDKFSITYVFFYAIIITLGLSVMGAKKVVFYKVFISFVFIVVIINASPIKQIVNNSLWTTHSSLRSIYLPDEYTHFLNKLKDTVSPSTTILSLPQNIAAYSIIKDPYTENVYAGTSPVKIITGINDLSGDMSFTAGDTSRITEFIRAKNYNELNKLLQKYNINYIFVTKNIPEQVKNSYLFQNGYKLKNQDEELINALSSKLIIKSEKGNYELYSTKLFSSVLEANNISFYKRSPVHYEVVIKNIQNPESLTFKDSYHPGWKLFIEPYSDLECSKKVQVNNSLECYVGSELMKLEDIFYMNRTSDFENTHKIVNDFGNTWTINKSSIENKGKTYYQKNADNTINVRLSLYFVPQTYFYIGVIVSLLTVTTMIVYLMYKIIKK